MIRSAASKVMWVGRATVFMVGLAVILALVLGAATTAMGANGNPFVLGKGNNVATKVTGLIGKVATGSALVVKNPSGGSALALSVGDPAADPATKTVAPMKVNSQAQVANLNADRVDGEEASSFADGVGGVATNADKLDDLDASQLMRSSAYTRTLFVTGAANTTTSATASCHPGDKVLSGGYGGAWDGDSGDVNFADTIILRSVPATINDQGWTVVFRSGATADDIKVRALCADQ